MENADSVTDSDSSDGFGVDKSPGSMNASFFQVNENSSASAGDNAGSSVAPDSPKFANAAVTSDADHASVKSPDLLSKAETNTGDPIGFGLGDLQRKKKVVREDPVKTIPKIKFQLPENISEEWESRPKIALYKTHCWIVDEKYIYCYSIRTGQRLEMFEHGIMDPELIGNQLSEANEADDNGLFPNIVSVSILQVYAPKLVLVVATNFIIKMYWIPTA